MCSRSYSITLLVLPLLILIQTGLAKAIDQNKDNAKDPTQQSVETDSATKPSGDLDTHSTPQAEKTTEKVPDQKTEDFDNMSLEELLDVVVTETATKVKMRASEVPSVISVITSTDIRDFGFRTVAEALGSIPGLYVRDDLVHPNVSMRGIDAGLRAWSRHLKVMINGQPISYRSDTSNWLGPELIPIDAISRIEIIRGPASTLYGANAFLGVINIITKEGTDLEGALVSIDGSLMQLPCPAGNDSLTYIDGDDNEVPYNSCSGSRFGKLNGGVDMQVGKKFKFGETTWDFMLAGHLSHEDRSGLLLPSSSPHFTEIGARYFTGPDSDITSQKDSELPVSLYTQNTISTPRLGKLTIDGHYMQFRRGGEFTDWGVLTHDNTISLRNWFVRARHSYDLSEIPLGLYTNLSLGGGEHTGQNHFQISPDNSFWVQKEGGYLSVDGSFEARYKLSKKNQILAGVNLNVDNHDLPSVYSIMTASDGSELTIPSSELGKKLFLNLGVYGQVIYNPFDILGLIGGLSYEYHNIYGKSCSGKSCPGLNARAGAVLFPIKKKDYSIFLKALYGSSFKAPSAELIYGAPYVTSGITGNQELKAQTAHTFELVIGSELFSHVDILINGFFNIISGKVEYIQAGNFIKAMNSSNLWSYGVEAMAKVKFPIREGHSIKAHANFSWQQTVVRKCLLDFQGDCDQLTEFNYLYPTWLSSFGVTYHCKPARFLLSLSGTYVGTRWASQSNRLENLPSDSGYGYDLKAYRIPEYFLLKVFLSTTDLHIFNDRETVLSFGIHNLFNHATVESGFGGIDIPGRGRTFLLVIKQRI